MQRIVISSKEYLQKIMDPANRGPEQRHKILCVDGSVPNGQASDPKVGYLVIFAAEPDVEYHVLDKAAET